MLVYADLRFCLSDKEVGSLGGGLLVVWPSVEYATQLDTH